jgi:hypothetical protein
VSHAGNSTGKSKRFNIGRDNKDILTPQITILGRMEQASVVDYEMSDKNMASSTLPGKTAGRKFLGITNINALILVLVAFLIPFLSWYQVLGQMVAHAGLIINVGTFAYTIHLLIPIVIFILAVISGRLTTSIVISLAAVTGYIIIGFPYYWDPTGWDPGTYPPTPDVLLSDTSMLLLNLLVPGILGGVLSQFGVINSAKNDMKELARRPVAIILLFGSVGASGLLYGRVSAATLTATSPVTFAYLLIGVLAIVALVSFSVRNAYGGLVVGFLISLVYYSVAAAKDPSSEILAVFAIGVSNWVRPEGLDVTLQSYYISYGFGFFIAALWGSIWGVLGKYMIYSRPPKLEEKVTEAHIFRDLWSNYFIFGKNTRPEFRLKEEAGTTMTEGAALTEQFAPSKAKGKYVTYRYLDRKKRFERVPASIGGLIVEPLEGEKCKVYERVYKARGQEDKVPVGEFLDPKPLFDKYRPMWSPFAFALREYAVKVLSPFVILPIIIGLVIFSPVILSAYAYIFSGSAGAGAGWILIAEAVIGAILIYFILRWRRRLGSALKAHPEGALAFLFVGAIAGVLFVFSLYMLSQVALVVQSGTIDAFSSFTTSAIVILLILSIFTSASTVQILGVDNVNMYFYDDEEKDVKPYKHEYDKPVWLKGSHYWVFRFMYFWPFEMTPSLKGFGHEDFERVELWINAESGKPEWTVSDYHWREIWYKIPEQKGDVAIQVNFTKNFHTPVMSVVNRKRLETVQFGKESWVNAWKAVFYYMRVSRHIGKETKRQQQELSAGLKKRGGALTKFFIDLPAPINAAAANTMAGFPWNLFRFPKGVASVQKVDGAVKYVYREKSYKAPFPEKITGGTIEAEEQDGLGSPASVDEEFPQLCPKCGKPLPKSLVCSADNTDATKTSFLVYIE